MKLNISTFEAQLKLYAIQAVASIEHQALDLAQRNLVILSGPEKRAEAVKAVMGLYTVFEAGIPVLALTTLDDALIEQLAGKAVDEAFKLTGDVLNQLSAQVKQKPADVSIDVPDTTFPAPVTNDPTLTPGGIQ